MNNNFLLKSVLTALFLTGTVYSQSSEEKRIQSSITVLESSTEIPDSVLKKAQGMVIVPDVVKIGLGVAGFYGQGVFTVRKEDGCWSYPVFLSTKGGSIGAQAGHQVVDVIFIFTTKNSLMDILNGKMVLGADATFAAGPVKKQANGTVPQSNAEIYTYTRNRGVVVNATLKGTSLSVNDKANEKVYKYKNISERQIINGKVNQAPQRAVSLQKAVSDMAGGCKKP